MHGEPNSHGHDDSNGHRNERRIGYGFEHVNRDRDRFEFPVRNDGAYRAGVLTRHVCGDVVDASRDGLRAGVAGLRSVWGLCSRPRAGRHAAGRAVRGGV